jgi:hypothetical protein
VIRAGGKPEGREGSSWWRPFVSAPEGQLLTSATTCSMTGVQLSGSRSKTLGGAAVATVVSMAIAAGAGAQASVVPPLWKNCTHVNAKYHHGVGRVGAHDHTSGKPVTTFLRNNRLYALAMKYNANLDRDSDHIACESA